MTVKHLVLALLTLALTGLSGTGYAQNMEEFPPEIAQRHAELLVKVAEEKIKSANLSFKPATKKAQGVRAADAGAIVVPSQDLHPQQQDDRNIDSERGAPLGYLFLKEIEPAKENRPVEASRLYQLVITGPDGGSHQISALILAARRLQDDEWGLYAYGPGKQPVIDVPFEPSDGEPETDNGSHPLRVAVTQEGDAPERLSITVFGRYEAGFQVAGAGKSSDR